MPTVSYPTPVVQLRSASVAYGDRLALAPTDLDVRPGTLTVVTGPNGAGKSTLLEVVAGTRPLTGGSREVAGAVAFVPQRTDVSTRLPVTVRDVVEVGAWGRSGRWGRTTPEMRSTVEDALAALELTALAPRPFSTLSGGQRQRTLLAQGLVRGASLLLLDEPTTGLDRDSALRIRRTVRAEVQRGTTVVCVSHDDAVVAEADRVLGLQDGVVVSDSE